MSQSFTIGQVAARSGVPAKTIRYYEDIGLIPEADRAPNGYRRYDHRAVETLRFVHRARNLGFSIDDVEGLLELWANKHRASREVRRIAAEHIEAIERKIAELDGMRATLSELVHRCQGDDRPECPILDELAEDDKNEDKTMMTTESTYRVEGMTCDGCVRTVTKVLTQALPGAEVEVTLEGGLVRVRGEHSEADIREAVEDAGFDFAGAG